MANKKFWLGMLVMVLAFGMMVIGCEDEPDNPSKKKPPVFPAAKGKLTINGLSSFNDKYVYVQGLAGGSVLTGLTDITDYPSDITYKLVKISGGKAEVPLYTANPSASSYSNSFIAYNGNDAITSVSIMILSDSLLRSSNAANAIMNNLALKRLTSGSFSNGSMTVDWGAIDKFPAAKGKLTINGLTDLNDKYVYVQGTAGSSVLTGLTDITGYPSDITYKLVKISGGKAEVPLYTANPSASSTSNSFFAYSGNDTITSVNIVILSESSLKASNASNAITSNPGKKTLTSGTFSNGNMTVDWGTIDKFPAAEGKLTINGLSSFNDKYVYVQGLAGGSVLVGLTDITDYPLDITYKLIKISGGKAEVPLYTANASASSYSNSFIAYNGNDTITSVSIIIINDSSLKASNASNAIMNNLGLKRITSGTFSKGNMTVDWGTVAGTWTPSGGTPTQLTENQWANGNISTSSGEQWFTFTATASTQYIHVTFGTLTDLYVWLYDSNGNTVGSSANLYNSTKYTAQYVTSGQKYYIKVWPYSGYSGNYQIVFSASSSTPSGGSSGGGDGGGGSETWTPSGGTPTQLTLNQWANGSISTSSGEQWFTFTATAYTQYIHVNFGTLTDLYVQLYDSSGNTVGSNTNLYNSTKYISRSVTSGQKYYIKVWPYSGNNGSYQIVFSTSSSTPSGSSSEIWAPSGGTPTQLTLNQWANGSISTGGEQWFTFTATAYTQYIHVSFGTLTDLYVQLYDSSGNTVGNSTNLYSSTKYISRSVTSGQKYYIKVWPYNSYSGSGSYQIAFNTSSSSPSSGYYPPPPWVFLPNSDGNVLTLYTGSDDLQGKISS